MTKDLRKSDSLQILRCAQDDTKEQSAIFCRALASLGMTSNKFQISALTYVHMRGYNFSKYDPRAEGKSKFEQLLDIFMQLLTYTNGDVAEALNWMNQLDKEYQVTNEEYGMGDFIEDLKEKGYIQENPERGTIKITPKTEQGIRKKSLEEIFGKLKKNKTGRASDFQTRTRLVCHPERSEGSAENR